MPAALKTIQHLCGAQLTDADLLNRFLQKNTGAFEALLARHGPLVLSVCRRILKNRADAEDAFQATFFVLLRTARSVRKPESLASWLHGVARRTALHARRAAAKRRSKEAEVLPRGEPTEPDDLGEVLDEEIDRLPEPYRAAVVLCDLEGKTRKEAARELGCAEGTVASRISRGRSLLAGRLSRRGVTLSGVLCSVVPASLVASTLKLATGPVSASVAALTQGVLKVMLLNKLKRVIGVLMLLGALTVGTGFALSPRPGPEGPSTPTVREAKEEVHPVTIGELSASYAENDASGDERFAGKRVRVSGHVLSVKWAEGRYVLTLGTRTGQGLIGYDPTVAFQFRLQSRKQLAVLTREQQVTVEGLCDGMASAPRGGVMIRIRDCRLVAVGPAQAPQRP